MIPRFLARYTERAYAVLRIVAGLLFLFHGIQKLFGVLGKEAVAPGELTWFGGLIEITTGTAIALGLFTSWAAFLASGTMAVAYVKFHWKFAFDDEFFPIVNKGELALLYSFLFLYVACRGAGTWSVDGARREPATEP
jgi:putative oxidoreductase